MSDNLLVMHCSPTLAGMKTGSLFNCSYGSLSDLFKVICGWNCDLNKKGLYIRILNISGGRALVYVYRPRKLLNDFENAAAVKLLRECGYKKLGDIESMIDHLSERISQNSGFPHEIGLFLGYPYEDVKGFIDNNGKNCKCVGLWKVYSDEVETEKLFNKFRKCTDVYCRKLLEGLSLQRLTVAS